MAPFVWFSERITRLIARSDANASTVSRDEMRAMAEIGAREGVIDDKELAIVSNLLRLHRLKVEDIMTPASVMFAISEAETVREFFEEHADTPFSRLPLFTGNAHQITGYVLKSDLLLAQARDEFDRPIGEFKREVMTLRDDISASAAYDRLTRSKSISLSWWMSTGRCAAWLPWKTWWRRFWGWKSSMRRTRRKTCRAWPGNAGATA